MKISNKSRLFLGIGSLVACGILVIIDVVFVLLPTYSLAGQLDSLGAAEVDRRLHHTDTLANVTNGAIIILVIFMIILATQAIISNRKKHGR